MPHSEFIQNGEKWPSVTEIVGQISGGSWLNEWYAKHGTVKAKVLKKQWGNYIVNFDQIDESLLQKVGLTLEDFWKDANDLKQEAQNRGIERHKEFEEYLPLSMEGALFFPRIEKEPYIYALDKWLGLNGMRVWAIEKKIINRQYKFHGSCDAVLQSDTGIQTIIDWKFTKKLYLSGLLQLAGYDLGLGENFRTGSLLRFYEVKRLPKQDNIKKNFIGQSDHKIYQFKNCPIQIEELKLWLPGIHKYFLALREIWEIQKQYKF